MMNDVQILWRPFALLNKVLLLFTTVVLKLNQGCFPKSGCNRFRGSFFGSFLEKQKEQQALK
jgi:hypothetical protein